MNWSGGDSSCGRLKLQEKPASVILRTTGWAPIVEETWLMFINTLARSLSAGTYMSMWEPICWEAETSKFWNTVKMLIMETSGKQSRHGTHRPCCPRSGSTVEQLWPRGPWSVCQSKEARGDHVALDSHKLERFDCLKWIVSCIWIFGAARKWTPCNFGVTFRYVILTNTTISKLSALPSIIPPVWRQKGQSLIKRFSENSMVLNYSVSAEPLLSDVDSERSRSTRSWIARRKGRTPVPASSGRPRLRTKPPSSPVCRPRSRLDTVALK